RPPHTSALFPYTTLFRSTWPGSRSNISKASSTRLDSVGRNGAPNATTPANSNRATVPAKINHSMSGSLPGFLYGILSGFQAFSQFIDKFFTLIVIGQQVVQIVVVRLLDPPHDCGQVLLQLRK